MTSEGPAIDRVEVSAFEVPTDQHESDGTLSWDSTTIVVVTASSGRTTGLGYTYSGPAAAAVVTDTLAPVVEGRGAMAVGASWAAMVDAVRNLGWPGLVSCAISAVDVALWDLKARLLGQPVSDLLDRVHEQVPAYGSGGFCSYDLDRLGEQLGGWADEGFGLVKLKVGRHPDQDPRRLEVAAEAVRGRARLMVDANGAYSTKEGLGWAEHFAEVGVVWLEEPVSSDDLAGLALLRDRSPGGLEVAAGEYGYHLPYFQHLLDAGAVDCLQADVTRCGGFTGFGRVAALCDARNIDLSAHCAPQLSAHACTAVWHLRHLEYFHDHVRIEQRLFDGTIRPEHGALRPDLDRPGLGLALRRSDAEQYRI